MTDGNVYVVAAHFYLLIVIFCRSGIFCCGFEHTQKCRKLTGWTLEWRLKYFEILGTATSRPSALFKSTHKVTSWETFCKKAAMRHTVAFQLLALPQKVRFLWFRGWSDGVRSIDRGRNPRQNQCCDGWQRSWSCCACLPSCSYFLPFRHLLLWLRAHSKMPQSDRADSGMAFKIFWNSWDGHTPSFSLVQKHAQGDELRNLLQKSGHAPHRCFPIVSLAPNVRFLWFRGWSDGVRSIDRGRNHRQN